jgi:hypothetical protein
MKAIAVFLLMFALPVLAQEHLHSSAAISGREHAGQISDSDAYRHFFIMVDPNKLPVGETEQHAAAVKIISAFKMEWDSRVAIYNAKATALNKAGQRADLKQFLADRDAFVEQTKKQLAEALSPKTMTGIDDGIQQLKQFIAVSSGLQQSNDPCVAYSNNIAVSEQFLGQNLDLPKPGQPISDPNFDPRKVSASWKLGILLDGAAIMTINSKACGQDAPDISTLTHTPELALMLDEKPSSRKGSPMCADCYINATLTETFPIPVGTPMNSGFSAIIHCSYGGDIF